ncbi:MAG: hypothetical protein HOW73_26995 [Polyangiaceae bacterium]|nr:hypothetical protein [Polyangiaceae bacterium]
MKGLKLLPAALLLFVLPARAQTAGSVAYFTGTDGDWFNASNWSTGSVPTAATDVVIDGAQVVIDPANGAANVAVRDLTVTGGGSLTTLPETIFEARDEHVDAGSTLFFRSSGSIGGSLVVESASAFKLNPSTQSKRSVIITTSVTSQFGLGGVEPASFARGADGSLELLAGEGHYATLNAANVALDGSLRLALHYDFEPVAGDSFEIITAGRSLTGEFVGLPEGSLVGCTEDDVGLYISYGGNSVVVSAEDTDPDDCVELPAIQPAREVGKVGK